MIEWIVENQAVIGVVSTIIFTSMIIYKFVAINTIFLFGSGLRTLILAVGGLAVERRNGLAPSLVNGVGYLEEDIHP